MERAAVGWGASGIGGRKRLWAAAIKIESNMMDSSCRSISSLQAAVSNTVRDHDDVAWVHGFLDRTMFLTVA